MFSTAALLAAALLHAGAALAVPAFPGAEGFGSMAQGGRGGRVIQVSNLQDSGPGSLREAIESEGPRTVVFAVAGTIELQSPLVIKNDFVTIAGQTARHGGITLKNYGLVIAAHHVVVRYLRARPGDASGKAGDAIWVSAGSNIIIDHCSASWASDETLSVSPRDKQARRSIDLVTVQWSLISESLNASVHDKGEHGYGSLIRGSAGARYSFHHNLWAHHKARMPRPGNYMPAEMDPTGPLIQFHNNVFYNWGGKASGYNADLDSISRYDFINNVYLPGPDSRGRLAFEEHDPLARLYFSGNTMDHVEPDDPWSLVRFRDVPAMTGDGPFGSNDLGAETAGEAYLAVLESAGASLARDAVDRRVVAEVRHSKGRIIDRPGDVGGWPDLPAMTPLADRDGDGMPDQWELRFGLDPDSPGDGSLDTDGNGYTQLEDYLNGAALKP